MQLAEMIEKRQSIRRYEKRMVEPETVAQIFAFIDTLKPLYADIGVKAELVEKNQLFSK